MEIRKAKEALKRQEGRRKGIKEGSKRISGGESKILQHYLEESSRLLEDLRQTEEGRNNEAKIKELAEQLNIEYKDLEDYFEKGLRFNIKAAYRLGELSKKLMPEEELRGILENIIIGYVLNFRSTLRYYLRKIQEGYEITPKTILEIASHAYVLPPRIIEELKENEEFKDIDDWIIKRAVVGYPTNPEEFLRKVKSKIEELKENEEFKDMDEGIIKHAVVHNPTNPEEFLRKVKSKIEELKENEEFKDMDEGIIKHAVVGYPTNPEEFLRKVKSKIEELKENEEFKDIDDWIIKRAVVGYPTNPEEFLRKVKSKIEELKENEEFKDIDDWIIKRAVVGYPTNPEEFLRKVKSKIEELKENEEFKDIDDWIIKHAVVGYPTNPEEFLSGVKERLKILEEKYPQLNPRLRETLAFYYPKTFIKEAQRLIEGRLKPEDLKGETTDNRF
ncbi:MAG: hypothetical protein KatS3mg095_0371 [Candidatus Parcubacteria bacterium]|nr:MAG: hypothetical protein KatS3mg095_0371 [Candidatus Parcubacteria bacterium]